MIAPTKEPKLEDMTLERKEKDTPQLTTRTVPTLVGYTNLQKLKIEIFLEQQSVIILINARSTHNFMSNPYIVFPGDKLLLKCYIPLNSLWLLISGDFHDFPQDHTMILKDFLDDDL
ncbi:hypothetical protein BHM03_00008688 [Ensete ventricosum]|nr:hypothetical protein BHM03_00008688 [Ensete ventricosum]